VRYGGVDHLATPVTPPATTHLDPFYDLSVELAPKLYDVSFEKLYDVNLAINTQRLRSTLIIRRRSKSPRHDAFSKAAAARRRLVVCTGATRQTGR